MISSYWSYYSHILKKLSLYKGSKMKSSFIYLYVYINTNQTYKLYDMSPSTILSVKHLFMHYFNCYSVDLCTYHLNWWTPMTFLYLSQSLQSQIHFSCQGFFPGKLDVFPATTNKEREPKKDLGAKVLWKFLNIKLVFSRRRPKLSDSDGNMHKRVTKLVEGGGGGVGRGGWTMAILSVGRGGFANTQYDF